MKTFFTYAFFVFSLASSHAASPPAVIRFLNGDQLHGQLTAISEKNITWLAPNSEPTPYPISDISSIFLPKDSDSFQDEAHFQVALVSGDSLPAQLVQLNATELITKTDFSDNLRIPREWIKHIHHTPPLSQLIYWGPNTKDAWPFLCEESIVNNVRSQKLKLNGSTYSATGSFIIAPHLSLPDDFELTFRLQLQPSCQFILCFHTDSNSIEDNETLANIKNNNIALLPNQLAQAFGNGLAFQFSSNSAQLFRLEGQKKNEAIEKDKPVNAAAPSLATRLGSSARLTNDHVYHSNSLITIRSSRSLGVIQLLQDQRLIATWNEDEFYPKSGNKISFSGGGYRNHTRLSEIRISHWNRFPDSVSNLQSPNRDVLLLASTGDRLSSDSIQINQDQISLNSQYGPITLPLNQLSHLSFASSKQKTLPAITNANPVTLLFRSGETISGHLKTIQNQCHFVAPFGASWPLDQKVLRAITFGGLHPNSNEILHED